MDIIERFRASTNPPLLLVVEPDSNDAEFLTRSLRGLGYRTRWSSDGFDALRQFRVSKPDMIVVNALLPDMYGSQVLEQIQADGNTLSLVLVNPEQIDASITDCLSHDYVFKPLVFNEIAFRVSKIFKCAQTPRTEIEASVSEVISSLCRLGPLRIDSIRQLVRTEKDRIDLTKTQFRLLEHLARHPGVIFDRDQLQQVARITSIQINVIDVHIYNLRSQLQVFGLGYLIETVRGQGYRGWHDPVFLEAGAIRYAESGMSSLAMNSQQ
jgi:two-component system, OmpR family, response regulator AdeR